jgi:coenzyme F420-reducing hydrogenase beta subunit
MNKHLGPYDIVRSGLCIGCGSCVAQSGESRASMSFDAYGQLKPKGDPEWYTGGSAGFSRTCPFSPEAKNEDQVASELFAGAEHTDEHLGRFQTAYVGYVAEQDFRMQGSSGGLVSWVATELLRNGLIDGVAHVVATRDPQTEGRYFRYRISRTEEEIREGAKSRYYPVEMSEILNTIREVPGRYAIVGIPCFIKAVHLLRSEDPLMQERIRYTLGIFCGHMKSARFIESFAWQLNVPVSEVERVEFREKDASRPANWYKAKLTLRNGHSVERDWWNLADGDWGAGYFMNHACNFCDDVVAETADISFGDAWLEPYSSDGKGTNVVVVRSPEIERMIRKAILENRLKLDEVDNNFVVETQAAGFRQRREGLAYRLTWNMRGIRPVKRVAPDAKGVSKERKIIYRIRYLLSKWSHRFFRLARKVRKPQIYIRWARMAATVYHGFAYHRGKLGEFVKRFGWS